MDQSQTKNQKQVLLVMDMQEIIIQSVPSSQQIFKSIENSIQAARQNKISIIYVVVGFRKGYPEISDNNKGFSVLKTNKSTFDSEEAVKITPSLQPQQDDIIVQKRRVSAFTGSDLEVILRGQDIKHLVLTGLRTSGVILSTIREAADKDYKLTVLSDCIADRDEEVHNLLINKVFDKQAEVIKSEQWIEKIKNQQN